MTISGRQYIILIMKLLELVVYFVYNIIIYKGGSSRGVGGVATPLS